MITLYGGGNVSTCGFSSGGALALGIAAHNNAQPEPLPQPRHIVVVSPGEVPWNDAEKARMQALNERDVSIDYAFMVTVKKIMRHGCENVPDYSDTLCHRQVLCLQWALRSHENAALLIRKTVL